MSIDTVYQENRALKSDIERLRARLGELEESMYLMANSGTKWQKAEIERLRVRVEEAEETNAEFVVINKRLRDQIAAIAMAGHRITDEQIDAAWKTAHVALELDDCAVGIDVLADLHIYCCKRSRGGRLIRANGGYEECPDCNGHGWVIGGDDE